MSYFNRSRAFIAFAVVSATAALPKASVAQTAVDEIIVTTRYEEENLQDVPIAVTAIGSEAIERKGINDLFQIAELDPSVSFDTSYGPGDTRVAIRGLSNTRGRSNVAFLIDGVDVTSENQIAAGSGLLANQRLLTDVERIEIVKGPQSALYGRAAFAGAIAYTTRNPSDKFEGTFGVDLAQGNEYQVKGSVSGPFTDTLGYRFDAVTWSSDGRYENSVSGADLGGGEGWASSASLRWEPSDNFDSKIRISYSDEENTPRPIVLMPGDTFAPYPQSLIDKGIGVGTQLGPFPGLRLGLVNHGTYCPDIGVWNDGNPLDPDFANTLPGVAPGTPGICQPGNFGSVSDLPNGKHSITHSETLYGTEQPGSTLDIFRTSIISNWEVPAGIFTFIGGYTDADQTDIHDQDFQAFGRPDRIGQNDPFLDYGDTLSVGHLQTDTETNTRQISGELRFATNFDGPVNATVGYLRWDQKVSTIDRNFISSCQKTVIDFTPGSENVITGLNSVSDQTVLNICDGGSPNSLLIGNTLVSGMTLTTWQDYINQFLVTNSTVAVDPRTVLTPGRIPGAYWQSDTEHQSVYVQVSADLNEKFRLTAEARWVDETFDIQRPNQASCGNIATPYGQEGGPLILGAWLEEGTGPTNPGTQAVPDLNCSSVTGFGALPGTEWAIIDGSESSDFIVPKGTLEWFVQDDKTVYFSYARGQKPGGINQLAAGGSAVTIDELRFDPEKMDTYELGAKTSWQAAGALVINGAVFFNDYTDKQISTQVLIDGVSTPRVTNASGAEVLGAEVDLTWLPEAVEGLTVRLAYTWQDATYTDFTDSSTDPIRAVSGNCNNDPDDEEACLLDLSVNDLERQAPNAFSANVRYARTLPESSTEWFLEGDASYTDKRFIDQDNFNFFDSYWLTNIRVGLQADKWDVLLFIDNALDDDTIRTGGSGPDFALQNTRLGFTAGLGANSFFGILPEPRTIGLRTNYRFGD